MSLVLGLKYCGSCNIRFDRNPLVERIREEFGDQLAIKYTNQGGEFDLILVLNACPSACANVSDLHPKLDIYVVRNEEDVDPNGPVIPWIASHLKNVENQ
ncbi:MAG: hypothetical protein ACOYCB_03210 [Fastidiosipilaceae bacterium]|jgi:hypothetical protein|nr:hypothetical protein [Clostridiaceae bacterium]